MNSVKPVLPQPGAPGVQASPAKAAVAGGALASAPTLVGQNLSQAAPPAQPTAHAPPSMAPVSANMAQMAQNMSHHGNLSHVTQNSAPALAPSPVKVPAAPLSLVQDKPPPSQPLALTRGPEKKEPDSTGSPGQPNGTIDSPKPVSNTPVPLKPPNPEPAKDNDITKTSPSTPKPPEKPQPTPSTPQKAEPANANQAPDPAQPKVATANEAPEKSPAKPTEPKPAPTADVAPSQSDNKPVPESAKDSQCQEKAPTPQKQDPPVTESAKEPVKEDKKPEPEKVDKPAPKPVDEPKPEETPKKPETPKKEEKPVQPVEKPEEKVEEKKAEVKPPVKPEVKSTPKSTLKLATVTTPMRKRRHMSPSKSDGPSSAKKQHMEEPSTPDSRSKRNRTKVQLYQSPTPDIAMATKLSASAGRSTPTKPNDDKLIVFYKNEYLAVRNAEGGFYVCQTTQNVYRTTRKIKIRWLSQDKTSDPSGETYKPDFYDVTDMECVLTTLSLTRAAGGGGAQTLKAAELARVRSILERALQAEQGDAKPAVTEEHPDGLDLSLYTDESQLEKKSRKQTRSKSSPRAKPDSNAAAKVVTTPVKKRSPPKRSPKKSKTPQNPQTKRKSAGTTPIVAAASKTATAVSEKAKTPKRTPSKRETPAPTPTRQGRRSRESKPFPIVPTPSTSTGKATRTPRKPPAKK